MEDHKSNLIKFRRLCGFHVKKKGGRIPKQADGYQELIFKYLNIDIAHDDSYIQPTLLCDKCR